jgi:tetratricopeptide (TPR) repeat protein
MRASLRARCSRASAALTLAALVACGGPAEADDDGTGHRASSGDEVATSASDPGASDQTAGPAERSAEGPAEGEPQQDAPRPDDPPPAPDSPRVARARELFAQGMQAYQANDFERAATLLTQVDEVLPSPEVAYNIAYCYQRMSEPERAVRYYRRYLETGAPTPAERADVEARIAAMEALRIRQRELTMALPPTHDAMTADAAALFDSGRQMFQRRRYPAALQAFSAAAAAFQAIGREVPELVYNLAITSERIGSLDDAADYYEEYLRQRPQDPEAERLRAHVRQLRERRRR